MSFGSLSLNVVRNRTLILHRDRFDFWSVDEKHVVAVALGPLTDATHSYQTSAWPGGLSELIRQADLSRAGYPSAGVFSSVVKQQVTTRAPEGLDMPLPPLQMKPLEFLKFGNGSGSDEEIALAAAEGAQSESDEVDSEAASDLSTGQAVGKP